MNLDNLCMCCMKEKEKQGGPCPYCKFDDTTMPNEASELPLWTILNKSIVVGKTLGVGGFGITYTAFDLNLERKCAVKEFFLDGYCTRGEDGKEVVYYKENEQIFIRERDRFVEEARILAELEEQSGVVSVTNYFRENDTAYIVMEYIEGESLRDYLKDNGGKLGVEETLAIMQPVIRSLAGVHEKGVIHRDISPDNIMITTDGKIKLIDFGAAKDKQGSLSEDKVYKYSYSPPEQQVVKGEMGTYSDVYALCATIYQMLTGIKPVNALERKEKDELISPSEIEEINPVLEAIILNGLELEALDRIKNASDLYYFLYVYGKEAGATPMEIKKKIRQSSTEVILKKMQKENKKNRNKQIAVIIGASVAVAFLLIILARAIAFVVTNNNSSATIVTETTAEEGVSLTELQSGVYELIKSANPNVVVNGEMEKCSKTAIENCMSAKAKDVNAWAEVLANNASDALAKSNMSDKGWVIKAYGSNPTAEDLYKDMCSEIDRNNKNAGIEDTLDLSNCNNVGISLGQYGDGTIFYMVIFI